MAVYHGKSGKIEKNSVAIVNITEWNIDCTVDIVEASDFGDTAKMFAAGMYEWGGSFSGHGDPENTEHAALFAALIAGTELSDTNVFIDGTHYYSGNIIITGFNPSTSISDLLKANFTFKGTGGLSYT